MLFCPVVMHYSVLFVEQASGDLCVDPDSYVISQVNGTIQQGKLHLLFRFRNMSFCL
jgi:hypothetical protein